MNVDTKIMSKIIATRIKKTLSFLIHDNQLGYVEDRFIGEAVRSLLDIMDYTKDKNIPGLLIFIDFEKAFDSLNWNFLFYCLKRFNFGDQLIRWVKVFFITTFKAV